MTHLKGLFWFLVIFSSVKLIQPTNEVEAPINPCVQVTSVNCPSKFITFHFYNQLINDEMIKIDFEHYFIEIEKNIPKAGSENLKLLVHDLNGSYTDDFNSKIITAYKTKQKEAIISVDYSALKPSFECYKETYGNVGPIAACIAAFLNHKTVRKKFKRVHGIGFGIGAQILGHTGKLLETPMSRLTGLDPMLLYFEYVWNLLTRESAKKVEVLHTNVAGLGYVNAIGHLDYYANGGFVQNGCENEEWISCSHIRAADLYAESILYGKSNAKIIATGYISERHKLSLLGAFEPIPDNEIIIFGEHSQEIWTDQASCSAPPSLIDSMTKMVTSNPIKSIGNIVKTAIGIGDEKIVTIKEGIYSFETNDQTPFTMAKFIDEESKEVYEKVMSVFNPCVIGEKIYPNEKVHFYFYTKDTKDKGTVINSSNLDKLNFIKDNPLKVLVHGMKGSHVDNFNKSLITAYFNANLNHNIISVDYSRLKTKLGCYDQIKPNAEVVEFCITKMLLDICRIYNCKEVHALGFGLGAQIIGMVGAKLNLMKENNTSKLTLSRATGLDPMLQSFETFVWNKINEHVAAKVDILHTACGSLGQVTAYGHADFYANSAVCQPGCSKHKWKKCSHFRSYELYADSIHYGKTSPFRYFILESCTTYQLSLMGGFKKVVNNRKLFFGEYFDFSERGLFYFSTGSEYPYTPAKIKDKDEATHRIVFFNEQTGEDIGLRKRKKFSSDEDESLV